jgi:hypothetical protein
LGTEEAGKKLKGGGNGLFEETFSAVSWRSEEKPRKPLNKASKSRALSLWYFNDTSCREPSTIAKTIYFQNKVFSP